MPKGYPKNRPFISAQEEALQRLINGSIPEPNSGCWLWLKGLSADGYARIMFRGRDTTANRVAAISKGIDVPDGYEMDHKCRVRCCVNPDHLECVTKQVNIARGLTGQAAGLRQRAKTHCPKGHPYSPENLRSDKNCRSCKACHRDRERARRNRGRNE